MPYRRSKRAIPWASRQALAARHGCGPGETVDVACAFCGAPGKVWRPPNGGWVTFPGLEIDHVIPEIVGGSSHPDNLRLLCRRCNRSKGARLEVPARRVG